MRAASASRVHDHAPDHLASESSSACHHASRSRLAVDDPRSSRQLSPLSCVPKSAPSRRRAPMPYSDAAIAPTGTVPRCQSVDAAEPRLIPSCSDADRLVLSRASSSILNRFLESRLSQHQAQVRPRPSPYSYGRVHASLSVARAANDGRQLHRQTDRSLNAHVFAARSCQADRR